VFERGHGPWHVRAYILSCGNEDTIKFISKFTDTDFSLFMQEQLTGISSADNLVFR